MENVVLCYRHEDGDTKLIKISDLPDADILPLQGGLGDLITREVLDKYLSFAQISGKAQSGDERMAGISALKPYMLLIPPTWLSYIKPPLNGRKTETLRR